MSEKRVLSLGETAEKGARDPETVNKIAHWVSVTKEVLDRTGPQPWPRRHPKPSAARRGGV